MSPPEARTRGWVARALWQNCQGRHSLPYAQRTARKALGGGGTGGH